MEIRSLKDITKNKINTETSIYNIIDFFNGKEFSSDFIFLSKDDFEPYNSLLEDNNLENDFIVFGTNICGDLWIAKRNTKNVYFYNHNSENITINNLEETGINIYNWIIYADLFSQKEYLDDNNLLSEDDDEYFIRQLKYIPKNLIKILF